MVDGNGDKLAFRVARLQRVVNLLRDQRDLPSALRCVLDLAQVPAREVGCSDVTNLPARYEAIKSVHRLIDRRLPVPGVQLIEINRFDLQPPQALLRLVENA